MPTAHRPLFAVLTAITLAWACPLRARAAEPEPVQRLVVQFYSDPGAKLAVEEVSVEYDSAASSPQQRAEHFFEYASWIMLRLKPDSPVFSVFVEQVMGSIDAGLSEETDLLTSEHYRMKLVAPRDGARKTCTAAFFADRPAEMACSQGGEAYYGPMSAFAFLQHIVDASGEAELAGITKHLYRLFAALAERREQPAGEGDAPATAERLVMRWVASMGRCIPGGADDEPATRRARIVLGARVLVARYLYVDMLLYDRLKDKPGCRKAYIEQVTGLLTDDANDEEAMRIFHKPYKMWFAETTAELLGRVKKGPQGAGARPLSTRLAEAAAAFDARFEGQKEAIRAAAACLEADAQVIGAVVEVASGMCE